jgi:hypothetical protein
MRFRLHNRDRITASGLERIYIAGQEDIPWPTRARWEGEYLLVERQVSDSGTLYVPWQVDGHGLFLLGTSTLIERERPYLLAVELARGLLQRIRTRLFHWELLGLDTPTKLKIELREATREFSRASTSQYDLSVAAQAANHALSQALTVANALVTCYAKQSMAARQRQGSIAALLGVTLGVKQPTVRIRRKLVDACNIIQLPISWRELESREGRKRWKPTDEQLGWCQTAGLKVSVGPLLQLDDRGIPDWMYLWEGDFENLARLMLEHVRTVVSRYAGRVHLWHVAARVNNGILLSLDEEQRLQLVAQALQLTRQIDPRTPMVVSLDQPWGEYLAHQDRDLAPFHFADTLVRADLGLSGIGLEINAGYHPHGSPHRPAIDYGHLLDQWSLLGLPLMVLLTGASSMKNDPQALPAIHVEGTGQLERMSRGKDTSASSSRQNENQHDLERHPADPQSAQTTTILPLLLARSTVQVVLWNQLSDKPPHEFPHSGLFDGREHAKPLLQTMRNLQSSYLT